MDTFDIAVSARMERNPWNNDTQPYTLYTIVTHTSIAHAIPENHPTDNVIR